MRGRLLVCRTGSNAREIPAKSSIFAVGAVRRPNAHFAAVLERLDVDDEELVWGVLDDVAVVVDLDELGPLGGRSPRG